MAKLSASVSVRTSEVSGWTAQSKQQCLVGSENVKLLNEERVSESTTDNNAFERQTSHLNLLDQSNYSQRSQNYITRRHSDWKHLVRSPTIIIILVMQIYIHQRSYFEIGGEISHLITEALGKSHHTLKRLTWLASLHKRFRIHVHCTISVTQPNVSCTIWSYNAHW